MQLYNTPTKQVEAVEAQNAPTLTIYTCGPTVYDYAHIGHWFTYVRADILIRTLKASGFQPKWVMNITDVGHLTSDADEGEDKLEKGAKREGKTAWEIADFYTADFLEGMKTLNLLQPDIMPKATDHIAEQIELIKALENKGYTYVIDDGVYFDAAKFVDYGKFAGLDLKEQQAGARVALNPQKRNPWDFALWKFSPKDQQRDMEWDSPWGKGFPGWHIECSAMSMKYLGETLDIHTGGIDHIPVHHTNEIAQSEAATGKKFVNLWMHANHVLVDGEKISKSLGNGIRLQEVVDRGIDPTAVRLNVLESHYRTQAKFSWENLEAAQNRLKDFQAMADLQWQAQDETGATTFALADVPEEIRRFLQDDLNTPAALAFLNQVSTQLQAVLVNKVHLDEFKTMLSSIDDLLGLNLSQAKDINDAQKQLITQREAARESKDWQNSDKLRERLENQGIGLRDTPSGVIWYRL